MNPWHTFCQWQVRRLTAAAEHSAAAAERWERRRDKARASLGLMGIAAAVMRKAGLDDESMDREEARLRRELQLIQAKRAARSNADIDATRGTPR